MGDVEFKPSPMATSLLAARLLGLIYLALGVGFIGNSSYYKKMMDSMTKSSPFLYFAGLLALTLGLLLVLFHNVWALEWYVAITILGWAALAKGLTILILPEKFVETVQAYFKGKTSLVTEGVIVMLLGLFLCYYGFIG